MPVNEYICVKYEERFKARCNAILYVYIIYIYYFYYIYFCGYIPLITFHLTVTIIYYNYIFIVLFVFHF
jgi:hypothetical protein